MVRHKAMCPVPERQQAESTCYGEAEQAADSPARPGQDSPAQSVTNPTFPSLVSKTTPKKKLSHARAGTYLKAVTL